MSSNTDWEMCRRAALLPLRTMAQRVHTPLVPSKRAAKAHPCPSPTVGLSFKDQDVQFKDQARKHVRFLCHHS